MKPTIIVKDGLVQDVLGLKEYQVLDFDSLENGTCPVCGAFISPSDAEAYAMSDFVCECGIDWNNPPEEDELARLMSENGNGEHVALKVYRAYELSEEVQKKVAEKFRHYFVEFDDWYDCDEDWFKNEKLKTVGLGCEKVYFSLFGQGQHAYLGKPYINDLRVLLKHLEYDLRTRLPRHIMTGQAEIELTEHSSTSYGWNSVTVTVYADEWEGEDDDVAEMEGAIKELMDGLCRDYRKGLEKTYFAMTEDEYILEGLEINDLIFLEDGTKLPYGISEQIRKET
jgi:hypothetical protein